MKLLRIAVVGIGAYESSRARAYLNVISKLKEYYTLCALCDQNKEKLNLVGKQFGVKALYIELENMLVSEKPDVVFVLVPTTKRIVRLYERTRDYH